MNEGIVSTRLGLPGKPAMAEEIMVVRDIKLARYTESRLHITGITSAKSLEYIRRAKEGNTKITCSVTPQHMYFTDEDMVTYDTNLKVNLPLREILGSRANLLVLIRQFRPCADVDRPARKNILARGLRARGHRVLYLTLADLAVEVSPPPYTGWPVQRGGRLVRMLAGSQVRIVGEVDRPLQAVALASDGSCFKCGTVTAATR